MEEYDYVAIGAGAAGFAFAVKLWELTNGAARIALINWGRLGGTCVNVGCVPSKYLIERANLFYEGRRNRHAGLNVSTTIDFEAVMEDLRRTIDRLRAEKYEEVIRSLEGVELINGRAMFDTDGSLVVDLGGETFRIRGRRYLVATGSRPFIPSIEGLEEGRYLTTDNIWSLTRRVSSLLVIGTGAVGVEIGQALHRLGVEVMMVEVLDRVLPGLDPEISSLMEKVLREEGVKIYTKSRIARVMGHDGVKRVEIITGEGKKLVEVEEILVAAGRAPNTAGLGLERVGVKTDRRGFILVDEYMQTSNPNIYAAGDVVSKRLMLETLAAREGVIAAVNMLGGSETIDYQSAPLVVFTDPQIMTVGYTEEESVQRLGSCSCRVVKLSELPKASLTGDKDGLAKIVTDPASGKVLGFHVASPNAAELALAASIMISRGYTLRDVIRSYPAFPTFSELLKLTAISYLRPVARMPCCVE